MERKLNKKVVRNIGVVGAIIAFIAVTLAMSYSKREKLKYEPEIARSMTYAQVQEGENIAQNTEGNPVANVRFDAFFLRDLDGDGYAESLRGTCREVGGQDTLYMELNVLTEGELRNAKISINGNNFYLATALPKDQQLKNNYIGTNIKTLEFNTMTNGTQKMLMGIVRSGDYTYYSSKTAAIGNNINNYSRSDNTIVLTGTYVDEEGNEAEIEKVVPLTVDWHGRTEAKIATTSQTYRDIDSRLNEEEQTITLDFTVRTEEILDQLLLRDNVTTGTIPELNGYAPISVSTTSKDIDFTYDESTRKFTITKEAEVDGNGNITKNAYTNTYMSGTTYIRYNSYTIKAVYPLEAYQSLGEDTVTIKIPVETYYEGYNNPNEEFNNPYKSNIAKDIIVVNYGRPRGTVAIVDITVGKQIYDDIAKTYKWIVSKQKPLRIYNEISEEEKDDTYLVRWYISTGSNGDTTGITLKETRTGEQQKQDEFIKTDSTQDSMEEVTTNIGIYFIGADNLLKEDGYIKVYDEETDELLVTFTKDGKDGSKKWGDYNSNNPYKYELPVNHIRVETSSTNKNSSLTVYNVKELNDEKITNTYTREEFDNLKYIKSNLVGYLGETYINYDTHQALYEAPYSVATIKLSKDVISTQVTGKNEKIIITAKENQNTNRIGWMNGSFLVKLPSEILDIEINDVSISNNNVQIISYEVIEQDGSKFIKINTENKIEKEQSYEITIDCNITPDPRNVTVSRNVELYATNDAGQDYYENYRAADIYDVNDNLNTAELINKTSTGINLVSPNSLLTNETITDYDQNGSITVAPQVAEVDYNQRTAKININLTNNYEGTISEVLVLGKIPFEGNTYTLSGGDLGSTFTATMKNTGIEVPSELQGKVTIYYSEEENPSKDITDSNNNWKTANQVTDWSKIKTYLIDFGDTEITTQKRHELTYIVDIPNGIDFNKVSYSHHGVYFSLHTDEGKYRTQTEPNKVGIRIAEKYNLELTKYQTGKDKKVAGATYSITEIINAGEENEEAGETKTGTTNANGAFTINNLYAEKVYEIKEIKSPTDYELNSNTIRFIAHANRETGVLTVEKISGTTKGNIQIVKPEDENYKAKIEVEDEAKARLKITKYGEAEEKLAKVKYKITGAGLPETGKNLTTNINGEATIKGLKIGEEYTLEEIKAEGYYLASPIKIKIVNNNGTYEVQTIEGTIKTSTVTEADSIPTAQLELEDEKIPTYDLELTKIKKVTEVTAQNENQEGNQEETTYLEGAKFRLYKGTEKIGDYITDENGKLTIENLYQYESEKDINQTYILKEILTPEGYVKVKDIVFKVEEVTETIEVQEGLEPIQVTKLKFIEELEEGTTAKQYTVEGNKVSIIVEDSPSFKLTKKDGETEELLANAKFAIYNVDNGETPARDSKGEIVGTKEIINGKEYYVVTTDSNGEITANLPEGIYKADEIEASDEKYDITGQTYYFGIGASREPETIMAAEWATSVGGSTYDEIRSIAETSDGGYVVGGFFQSSSIQVGDYTLTNAGGSDGMVIKYDSEGEVDWATSVGGSGRDIITSVSGTSDGGVAVGGYFGGNIQLGDYTLTSAGSDDGMVIKYRSDGEVEWATSVGGSGASRILSVTATSDGGYVAGGAFISTIQVGGYTLTNANARIYDGMVIKYGSNGEVEWATRVGESGDDQINSVAGTSDGGYVVGGYFTSSSIQVGDYTLTNARAGSYDVMIIKYSAGGEVEWATSVGGSYNEQMNSVAETSDGGIAVGVSFQSSSIQVGDYTLTNAGSTSYSDGMVIKYDSEGNVEWATSVGGSGGDRIESITATSDGGIAVGGYFQSGSIQVGKYTLTNAGTSGDDGMVIKYSSEGEVEWATSVGGSSTDRITSVAETSDGGYVVGGYFYSSSIQVGGYTLTNAGSTSYSDGMVIKYTPKEIPTIHTNWATRVGGVYDDRITSVAETSDGGYVVGGYFKSSSIQVGDYTLTNVRLGGYDGMVIKYDASGEVEWATSVGGTNYDYICSVAETSDGGIAVGGYFNSSSIQVGDYTLTNAGSYDGMLIKYSASGEVEWATSVGGDASDGITSVSGTSDGGITVGGYFLSSSIQVGDYTLTNAGKNDGMVIKYDANGNVEWATSVGGSSTDRITSVAETSDGGYVVGGYFFSGSIQVGDYTLTNAGSYDGMVIKYSAEGEVEWATSVGGSSSDQINSVAPTSDGGYVVGGYFYSSSIQVGGYTLTNAGSSDGMVIKYSASGKVEWATSVGGRSQDYINSVSGTSDGGYVVGGYFASSSIQVGDYTLTNAGSSDGMVIKYSNTGEVEWARRVGGSSNDEIASVATTSDGGYVVGGWFGSTGIQVGDYTLTSAGNSDGMVFKITPIYGAAEQSEIEVLNKRKQYKITTDVEEIDGIKGGSITGEDKKPYETVKHGDNSAKEIKMIPDADYEIIGITVNGEEYPYTAEEDGTYTMPQFTNVTENKHVVVKYAMKSNIITINKVDSKTGEKLQNATFKLEKIDERTEEEKEDGVEFEVYETEVITNSQGQAITQIPFGKYAITEIEAPEGYLINESIPDIEFRSTNQDEHEITIEDETKAKITVHHYLKDSEGNYTTTKVAEDEHYEDKAGEKYTTEAKIDLAKYELEKDVEGNYVLPENATGEFAEEEQEIIYYYELKQVPLTVHHYIEGTTTPVPLKEEGTVAEDEYSTGIEGQEYTTNAKTEEELAAKYKLIATPENAEGTYEYDEVVVTYYYAEKEVKVTTRVEAHEETNSLTGETKEVKGGSITGEGENPYEAVTYGEDSIKEITAIPEEGYQVKRITINNEEIEFAAENDGSVSINKFTQMTEDKDVVVEFERIPTKVIVHHYIEGTTTRLVEDEEKIGVPGDMYVTKPSEDVGLEYKVVSEIVENGSGLMKEDTIEVIYYYRLNDETVTNTITKTASPEKITIENEEVTYNITYTATIKDYIGKAKVTVVDTLPAAIDESKSNLAGGTYDSANKTITWEEEVTGIDTYTNGDKVITIEKEIKVVYDGQEVTKDIVNIVKGSTATYYPNNYPEHSGEEKTKVEKEDEATVEQEYKVDITVNKVWLDNEVQAQRRPDTVKLQVKNGDTVVQEYTLNVAGDANAEPVVEPETGHTFTGLPKYTDTGEEITYTVDEVEVNANDLKFYTKSIGQVTGEDSKQATITNTFTVPDETVDVTVNKTWIDNAIQALRRPESIKLQLKRGQTIIEEFILNTNGN